MHHTPWHVVLLVGIHVAQHFIRCDAIQVKSN
jgi:hypothetical protein